MILNGAVFIGVGLLLLKTSDDPVRATLFWTANPVLIQQLVSGGHLDTFVAAATICSIQVARRVPGVRGDVLIGVLIGLACGVKIYAVLIGIGLAWPLLRRHEWMRAARVAVVSLATLALEYSFYGLAALKPLFGGLKLVTLPSPWWSFDKIGLALGVSDTTMTTAISCLWPVALIVVAWLIYRRISSDQPQEVVMPFALTFAWVLVAPWVFAWIQRPHGPRSPTFAQPDDPMAGDCHCLPRPVPFQRRPGCARTVGPCAGYARKYPGIPGRAGPTSNRRACSWPRACGTRPGGRTTARGRG